LKNEEEKEKQKREGKTNDAAKTAQIFE